MKHDKILSYTQIFFLVVGITMTRVIVEWRVFIFPIQLDIFQDYVRFSLENTYYFLIVFLIGTFFLSKITNKCLRVIMNFGVRFYPIIILPPLIDRFVFGRIDGYGYATISNVFNNFLTLSFLKGDATLGISIEILIGLAGLFIYVYHHTKSILKSAVYCAFFDLLLVLISTPDLFFGERRGNYYYDYFLPSYYFFPFLIFLVIIPGLLNIDKLRAILGNIRPVRASVFVGAVILGVLVQYRTLGYFYEWKLVLAALAMFFVWGVSVIINDIADISIDHLTNKSRPLVKGALSVKEYKLTAVLFSFFALSYAAVVNEKVLLITIAALIFSWIYSLEPFRFRKNFLGNIIIGLSVLVSFWAGIFTLESSNFIDGRSLFLSGLIFLFGVIMSLAKDIKDVEGDKQANIWNLYVVLGKKKERLLRQDLFSLY